MLSCVPSSVPATPAAVPLRCLDIYSDSPYPNAPSPAGFLEELPSPVVTAACSTFAGPPRSPRSSHACSVDRFALIRSLPYHGGLAGLGVAGCSVSPGPAVLRGERVRSETEQPMAWCLGSWEAAGHGIAPGP